MHRDQGPKGYEQELTGETLEFAGRLALVYAAGKQVVNELAQLQVAPNHDTVISTETAPTPTKHLAQVIQFPVGGRAKAA